MDGQPKAQLQRIYLSGPRHTNNVGDAARGSHEGADVAETGARNGDAQCLGGAGELWELASSSRGIIRRWRVGVREVPAAGDEGRQRQEYGRGPDEVVRGSDAGA